MADLPPFERAVVVVKYFEGLHGWKNYPYVGYGHQLQRGEYFTADMTERQADSLLRADLMKHIEIFKKYGKDALLLAVLSYNIGVGRILGYGKHPKSQLLRKIEAGDRNFYKEFVAFCRYKGKVLRGLLRRRQVEYTLFCLP
ncbi:lysozyme [Hoylesella loescheii]|uniref:Lysozyme n=1 Tax=Hoylesella loescheii DSM 19665 = JCM 12249 = ATCC 15930 TaxID=1122985 RepID=A0A069QMS1_HOYLO|nr:glycoside hydrolase family protein [Hoylesella loescheii]KDR53314.1 phage lysozyme [Hoylesella loescheii DSM 19665 = JCM 12249 = ATCC 15930]